MALKRQVQITGDVTKEMKTRFSDTLTGNLTGVAYLELAASFVALLPNKGLALAKRVKLSAVDNYDMEDADDGGDDGYGIGSSGNGRHSDEDDHGPAADKLFALRRRYDNGEFDVVAVGRPLISDPDWVRKIETGDQDGIIDYTNETKNTYP